jgi:hypothetical protein
MMVIQISRQLFYNTPLHRLTITNIIYNQLFHVAYPPRATVLVQYEGIELNVQTDDITILPTPFD